MEVRPFLVFMYSSYSLFCQLLPHILSSDLPLMGWRGISKRVEGKNIRNAHELKQLGKKKLMMMGDDADDVDDGNNGVDITLEEPISAN